MFELPYSICLDIANNQVARKTFKHTMNNEKIPCFGFVKKNQFLLIKNGL